MFGGQAQELSCNYCVLVAICTVCFGFVLILKMCKLGVEIDLGLVERRILISCHDTCQLLCIIRSQSSLSSSITLIPFRSSNSSLKQKTLPSIFPYLNGYPLGDSRVNISCHSFNHLWLSDFLYALHRCLHTKTVLVVRSEQKDDVLYMHDNTRLLHANNACVIGRKINRPQTTADVF